MENTQELAIDQVAERIDAALSAASYKPINARTAIWRGVTRNGKLAERIYLNGRQADGYVHLVNGKWTAENVSFLTLLRIVEAAIK